MDVLKMLRQIESLQVQATNMRETHRDNVNKMQEEIRALQAAYKHELSARRAAQRENTQLKQALEAIEVEAKKLEALDE